MPSSAAVGFVNRSWKKPSLTFHQILSNKQKKLAKNGFAVSNVERIKNVFQRIQHHTSAQSILKSMKCISKSIHFYTLNFIHYKI